MPASCLLTYIHTCACELSPAAYTITTTTTTNFKNAIYCYKDLGDFSNYRYARVTVTVITASPQYSLHAKVPTKLTYTYLLKYTTASLVLPFSCSIILLSHVYYSGHFFIIVLVQMNFHECLPEYILRPKERDLSVKSVIDNCEPQFGCWELNLYLL